MSKVEISKPEGAIAISFKHEWEDNGMAVGPARWIIEIDGKISDQNVIDSDFEDFLPTVTVNPDGTMGEEIPPSGFTPAWLPLSEVNKIARHFGVEVDEG